MARLPFSRSVVSTRQQHISSLHSTLPPSAMRFSVRWYGGKAKLRENTPVLLTKICGAAFRIHVLNKIAYRPAWTSTSASVSHTAHRVLNEVLPAHNGRPKAARPFGPDEYRTWVTRSTERSGHDFQPQNLRMLSDVGVVFARKPRSLRCCHCRSRRPIIAV